MYLSFAIFCKLLILYSQTFWIASSSPMLGSVAMDRSDGLIAVGDMLLTPAQYARINGTNKEHSRGISPIDANLWDIPVKGQQGKVGVPFKIDRGFTDQQTKRILNSLKEIEDNTCIRYLPYDDDPSSYESYIYVLPNNNGVCSSQLGKGGGKQILNLWFKDSAGKESCNVAHGTIIHEFVHALGFSHEHNRHDRDDYVTLDAPYPDAPNACTGINYDDHEPEGVHTYDVGYDYCSVMHYGMLTACRITPKHKFKCNVNGQEVTEIGQRLGLSKMDIEEINKRYNCKGTTPHPCVDAEGVKSKAGRPLPCKDLTGQCGHPFVMKKCRKTCGVCTEVLGTRVNCGSHTSSYCYECPRGKKGNGAQWCKGDCKWDSSIPSCLPKEGSNPNPNPQPIPPTNPATSPPPIPPPPPPPSTVPCKNHAAFGDELCEDVKKYNLCGHYGKDFCKKACGLCGA